MVLMSRTPSVPNSTLRYCSDKAQYFGLEFSFYPLLFPNKKTETPLRVILFIQLVVGQIKYFDHYFIPNPLNLDPFQLILD